VSGTAPWPQVNTAPQSRTSIPADTAVFVPVLPEVPTVGGSCLLLALQAVPMFAQVPDVAMAPGSIDVVQISQVRLVLGGF
jgi:hypothetical protein